MPRASCRFFSSPAAKLPFVRKVEKAGQEHVQETQRWRYAVEEHGPLAVGLMRVTNYRCDADGLELRLSVASSLSGTADAVLYVMDAEPELFSLACIHLYGRTGYETEIQSSRYSPLRNLAIVGVGHHPETFGASSDSWDIDRLRHLRRRDYWKSPSQLLHTLCNKVVPWCEEQLHLGELPALRRAILGCSLSGGFALRALLLNPCIFGSAIVGSPSLQLMPDLFELVERSSAKEAGQDLTALIFLVAQLEKSGVKPPGNRIPEMTEKMSALLRAKGKHAVGPLYLEDEAHETMTPALLSRGMSWLEERLCGRRVFV